MENPTGLFPIDRARRSNSNLRSHSLKYSLNFVLFLSFSSGLGYEMSLWGDYCVKEKHHNRIRIREQDSTDPREKLEKENEEREVRI